MAERKLFAHAAHPTLWVKEYKLSFNRVIFLSGKNTIGGCTQEQKGLLPFSLHQLINHVANQSVHRM